MAEQDMGYLRSPSTSKYMLAPLLLVAAVSLSAFLGVRGFESACISPPLSRQVLSQWLYCY